MRLNHRGHRGSQRDTVKHFMTFCVSLCPLWLIVFLFAAPIGQRTHAHSQEGLEMPVQERDRIRAPELNGGRGWLNTDKPLSLSALKGKVVVLDFWTYRFTEFIDIIPCAKNVRKNTP